MVRLRGSRNDPVPGACATVSGHVTKGMHVEVMLRCSVADRPGALAELTRVIADVGGDIQAVEVVEQDEGRALDDLVVVLERPQQLPVLVEQIEALDDVELIHTGPSRGDPGGAVTRIAMSFEHLLNGAMTLEHGVSAILGGALRAAAIEFHDSSKAPAPNAKRLVLPLNGWVVVVHRDYRFTPTEQWRGQVLLGAIAEATRTEVS